MILKHYSQDIRLTQFCIFDIIPFKLNAMLDDLQRSLNKLMAEHNNRGSAVFEGYAPVEMMNLLYQPFSTDSPIQIQKLNPTEYQLIPILNQVNFLVDVIHQQGELQLTKMGSLPTKVVAELYSQGFIKDDHIESGISKLYKETDSIPIHLTKILLEVSGIAKKRNNKLSLTKNGLKAFGDDHLMFLQIFKSFCEKFNWAYFDGYGENKVGQLGFGFSIILLNKYGKERHPDHFYAKKYFNAFPQFLAEEPEPKYISLEKHLENCYSTRTFKRFLFFFGLVKIDQEKEYQTEKYIRTTRLFNKLLKIVPPKNPPD